jgi:hypothetical protein
MVAAQESISGYVHNAETGEILPYVTVAVKGKNAGTISDRQGRFELRGGGAISTADSVVFSHVGFRSVTRVVGELSGGDPVALEPGIYDIEEIVVTNRRSRLAKLGHSSGGMRMLAVPFYQYNEVAKGVRIGKELGTTIRIRHDSRINSLALLINENRYKSAKFRVSFYGMEGETPGALIVNRDITFELKEGVKDRLEIDLTPYDIRFEGGQEILVTLTLLDDFEGAENPNRLWINGALISGKGIYHRNAGSETWERAGGTLTMYLNARIYL